MRSLPVSERSKNTVQRLLEAARVEFARHGYDGVRTPEVARRAGVSVGTLYRYFVDKRDLLYELTEDLVERDESLVFEPLGRDGSPRADFIHGINRYLDLLFAQRDILKAFVEASYRDTDFRNRSWRWELRAMQRLAREISRVREMGEQEARACATVIGHAIFRTVLVGDLYRRTGNEPVPYRDIREQLLKMICRYLELESQPLAPFEDQQIENRSEGVNV
ncbi:MAG: TetR/AcrR family transcriptional regulator [Candidatus Geothermincolia bacterium]